MKLKNLLLSWGICVFVSIIAMIVVSITNPHLSANDLEIRSDAKFNYIMFIIILGLLIESREKK